MYSKIGAKEEGHNTERCFRLNVCCKKQKGTIYQVAGIEIQIPYQIDELTVHLYSCCPPQSNVARLIHFSRYFAT